MGQIYSYFLDGLSFVLVLGVAVIIHEFGHFIVARMSGIRVEKFSVGFGKALLSFKRGGTEYILAPIPMGGYVKLAGDNPAEVTGADYEFYSVSPWRRIPTILAGPVFNVAGAFLIFFGLAFLFGENYNYNIIGRVIPGSIAEKSGLQKDDILLAVRGEEVRTWEDFKRLLGKAYLEEEKTLTVKIRRGEEIFDIRIPISQEVLDRSLVVAFTDPTGPAFELGIREGDEIVSIDGYSPETWSEFSSYTRKLWKETEQGPVARTVSLYWKTSSGEIQSASVTPALVKDATGNTITLLGIGRAEIGITPKVPPIVEGLARGFPAAELDIRPGAEIVAVNGHLVDNVDDIQKVISFSYEEAPEGSEEEVVPVPIEISWRNPGETEIRTATVTPEITQTGYESLIGLQLAKQFYLARLGIRFAEPSRPIGLLGSLKAGVTETVEAFEKTIFVLKGLFTGQVNTKMIGGPVAIIQLSAQVGKEGLRRLFWFCAFLQVNLALLNLLPIPILDGGHIVVALAEGVSRRTFTIRQREFISYIGAAFLIPLFLFVFINDFARIGLFDKIKELFF